MPNINKIKPRTLGFMERPELSVSIEFSSDEIDKNFLIRIVYIITNNSIHEKETERGLYYEGIMKSDKPNIMKIFKKGGKILRPVNSFKIHFEITFQPIFISPKYSIT